MSQRIAPFALLILMMVTAPFVAQGASIRNIRLAQHDNFTRTVLEYEGILNYRISNQSRDRREVVIDLSDIDGSTDRVSSTGEEEFITASMVESNSSSKQARVRLRTNGEVTFSEFLLQNPSRLVIDFYQGSAATAKGSAPVRTVQSTSPRNGGGGRRTIVIDPGHGGHHKGGVGVLNGKKVYEKTVTRAVAFKLERLLKADPRFDVRLTIRKDTYLGLSERTQIATQLNGDMFISIHANAIDGAAKNRARGFEMWTWNRDGSKRAAAKAVEAMENHDPGVSSSNTSIIGNIMLDALESQALVSKQVAKSFEASFLKHSYFRDHYRGIDSARFKVLEVYDMPSVLVELGFISHPEEVKMLFKDSFQQLCANAMYEGTVNYFERNDPTFPRSSTRLAKGR